MDFAAVSRQWGDFYAPAFVVRAGGRDLTRELAIGVSQVEVDLTLSAMGRFSFTVVGTYDAERRDFLSGYGERVLDVLTFQTPIEISFGYGDHSRLQPMIAGVVSEIGTSFSEGGTPELSVAGYDNLFPLSLGGTSTPWKDQRDSDVVAALARGHQLAVDLEPTPERHPQIEQNQRSDLDFIKDLAERNHYRFYMAGPDTLRFGRPNDRGDGILILNWGESLLAFKPVANLAAQVRAIEVYGWNPVTKAPIVGRAAAGKESGRDPRRRSGGQTLDPSVGRGAVLRLRQPVFTEAEARQRAEAILNSHAKAFLTGDGECIGVPAIRPDRNVTIGKLGAPFSKTYYVEQATHRIDGGGYRTRFKVKEPSLWH